jgi:ornithine cyclodeaminase
MTNQTKIDFIYLSEQDMIRAGVTDMPACVDTMEEMFGLLYRGITEWRAPIMTPMARW